MTRDQQIRVAHTYLAQAIEECGISFNTLQMYAHDTWGDIRSGTLSTEKTQEIIKAAKRMEKAIPEMIEAAATIDEQIRRAVSEEQIRMDTSR